MSLQNQIINMCNNGIAVAEARMDEYRVGGDREDSENYLYFQGVKKTYECILQVAIQYDDTV